MIYVIIIMGVSGSGKSTVGKALAKALDRTFYDGDDYHSPENIAKMSNGIPLTDTDRMAWLNRLRDLIQEHITQHKPAIIACSALKASYRNRLQVNKDHVRFVYLKGTYDLIWKRIQSREQHYMKSGMLQSQFADLEEPISEDAVIIDIKQDSDSIVAQLLQHMRNLSA